MPKINLLPPDLVPKSLTVKITKVIKQVVIVGFSLFICAAIIFIALFVLNTMKLNNLGKNRNQLLESIKNNQQVEQSLYLVRDRLNKIKTIQTQDSSAQPIKAIPVLLSQLPGSVVINQANLSPILSEVDFQTSDPAAVSQLMATMTGSNFFQTINLKTFSYNEAKGYIVGFELIK